MRFSKTEVSSFAQCYAIERPYLQKPDSIKENASDFYKIPSILVNLAQIVNYYTTPAFRQIDKICSEEAQVQVHNFSRSMVSHSSSAWDNEMDKLMKAIQGLNEPLITKQLVPKAELLKKQCLKKWMR